MRGTASWIIVWSTGLLLAGGCAAPVPGPPVRLEDYPQSGLSDCETYPPRTVIQYNLQRALNADLADDQRVASLQLVQQIGGDDPVVRRELAPLLSDPAGSGALRRAALEFLLRGGHPDLAAHVLTALPNLTDQADLRDAVLDWLKRNPRPEVLAEVVKAWAREKSATGAGEVRYRAVVERMARLDWEDALLVAINTPGFTAPGAALEVLSGRVSRRVLRVRIGALAARSAAVRALQTFLEQFAYLPGDREAFWAAMSAYRDRARLIPGAAQLYRHWSASHGYTFRMRDFHLLSRLARDPLRKNLRRTQIVVALSKSLSARKHVSGGSPAAGGADALWTQFESLSMVDLWNLYLMDELLSRPRIQMKLRIMARQDRRDTDSAHGGLVFYENGQAEARLYAPAGAGNDLGYVLGPKAVAMGRDALAMFYGHFEKAENTSRAGPDAIELAAARERKRYGLVLTTLGSETFSAQYYNPDGVVVSLGIFPFRQ